MTLPAALAAFNAGVQRAREDYRNHKPAPTSGPCSGCGRHTEARHGYCRKCMKEKK